jgi:hypothetical protein
LCNCYLIAWTISGVLNAILGQLFLMRSPTKFSWSNAFFIKTFDGPSANKFIKLFGLVGNLGISFGNMNYFHAQ